MFVSAWQLSVTNSLPSLSRFDNGILLLQYEGADCLLWR